MKQIAQYIEAATELIDLPIDSQYQEGVIANFERIAAIAQLITDFPLPNPTDLPQLIPPEKFD